MTVLANKSDAPGDEVEVTDADIRRFEEETGLKVLKTSAKTGQNVDESFLDMTKKLIVKRNSSTQEDKKKTIGLKKLKETIEGGHAASPSTPNFCCQ